MSFPQHVHHICLVSDQTLPNYLGAIVHSTFPKKLHLIVTRSMRERADILEKALRAQGREVEQYHINEPQPDFMVEALDTIYEKTGTNVAVNVTGGTKIMALTAVEWAGIQDEHPFLFYVDTDNKKIVQIGGKQEQFKLNTALKLKDMLKAGAGADILVHGNSGVSPDERDALEQMIETFRKNKNALELFNKCATEAQSPYFYTDLPSKCPTEFERAVGIAQKIGKIRITSGKLKYTSEEARFWCNGGWLEEFVKMKLYKMQHNGLIDDWGSNIEISRDKKNATKRNLYSSNPENELDAAFTVSNRLFVIECKTSNLIKRGGFSTAIYKLDSLRKSLGGVLSRAMIVSVFEAREEDIRRCNALRIKVVHGAAVLKLEEKLKDWI